MPTETPPAETLPLRCLNTCTEPRHHEGPCKPDDGTATYAKQRKFWNDISEQALKKVFKLMQARAGKRGRPSPLSTEMTIGKLAEDYGASRQHLYTLFKKLDQPRRSRS
jgi:AraC-like DNA-binding protein